jgi:hypothetical protein
MAVSTKMAVFWVVAPCSLVEVYLAVFWVVAPCSLVKVYLAVFWVVAPCSLVEVYQTTRRYNQEVRHLLKLNLFFGLLLFLQVPT